MPGQPGAQRPKAIGLVNSATSTVTFHDVEFGKRQPVRDFFRGAVERSRVKITNAIDRGRSRRAYTEFERVANLSNDLFEAAMVGGREHDRTDIAKWRDFLRRISPQSEVEIQRQEGS